MMTGYSHLVPLLFEFFPTGFLIGVIYSKIQDIHSLSYSIIYEENIMNISELCKYLEAYL